MLVKELTALSNALGRRTKDELSAAACARSPATQPSTREPPVLTLSISASVKAKSGMAAG